MANQPVYGPGNANHKLVEIIYTSKLATNLFKPRERNAILGEAARVMGLRWIDFWLPKRFTNYARTLGYRVTARYQKMKDRIMGAANAMPLIGPRENQKGALIGRSGFFKRDNKQNYGARLIETAQNASARSQAGNGNPSVTITVPTAHPVAAIVGQTIRNVPENERNDLAKVFGVTVTQYLIGTTQATSRGGKVLQSLSAATRRSLNVGRKTAASRAKTSRKKTA